MQSASISPDAQRAGARISRERSVRGRCARRAGVIGFAKAAHVVAAARRTRLADDGPRRRGSARRRTSAQRWTLRARFFPPNSRAAWCCSAMGTTRRARAGSRADGSRARAWKSGTVPLRNPERPEVLVERVDVPRRLKDRRTVRSHGEHPQQRGDDGEGEASIKISSCSRSARWR